MTEIIPEGLCQCGCGKKTNTQRCGKPYRFLEGHSRRLTYKRWLNGYFWNFVNKTDTCWLWIGAKMFCGYGVLGSERNKYVAHRVSWEIANGKPPDKELYVLHRCDIRACVNPDHLFLGTHQENMDDMKSKNRQACGAKKPNTKLKAEDVLKIRSSSLRHVQLAKIYNVSDSTIREARKRLTWKHL